MNYKSKVSEGKVEGVKVWNSGVGWVERSETQYRAISFQPSAFSRAVWVFGPASSSGSRQSLLVGMALAMNMFVMV